MENFDINSLDIKSLRLLVTIADTGSVTLSAERRGMTQSTASYQLARLRDAFDDPLFVRAGQGVTPTELGELIIGECREILDRLDRLAKLNRFDPDTARRDFVIAAAGYEIHTILAPLRRMLDQQAPHCRLIIRSLDLSSLPDRLDRDWDLALMAAPVDSPLLKRKLLFEDDYVTFFDPNESAPPDRLERFLAARHAVITLGGREATAVDDQLASRGKHRHVALVVNQFEALPPLMQGTDLVTTLPVRMGEGLMHDFAHCPCPVPLAPLPIQAVWHARKDSHPAHRWLRQLVSRAAKA